jgi:hypothetical protein
MIKTAQQIVPIAIDRSQKFYVIKFKAVIGKLIELDGRDFFTPTKQNFLVRLSNLKATDLIENGTDFFWLTIHRLYSNIQNGDDDFLKTNYVFFIINAFDSFYKLLPEESFIEILNTGEDNIPLVKNLLCFPFTSDRFLTLTKLDNNKLLFKLERLDREQIITKYEVDFNDIPVHHKLRATIYREHNNLTLLYQRHQSIFEDDYFIQCNGNPIWGHLLKSKLEIAISKIKSVDFDLYTRFINIVDYIIPLGSSNDIHLVSFTSAMLKRTIFLSIYMDRSFLIESMIHEFSHCELHYAQDTILLTNEDASNKIYYSPWRPDARPLTALLHGIYVFHAIVEFFDKLLEIETDMILKDEVHKRTELILNQLFIAIKQIRKNTLSDFAAAFIDDILSSCNQVQSRLNFDLNNPPTAIKEHKENWITEHSELTIIG